MPATVSESTIYLDNVGRILRNIAPERTEVRLNIEEDRLSVRGLDFAVSVKLTETDGQRIVRMYDGGNAEHIESLDANGVESWTLAHAILGAFVRHM